MGKIFSVKNSIPLAILAIGMILIIVELVSNVGNFVTSATVAVKHPVAYDFANFGRLLHDYVNEEGFVDYARLKKDPGLDQSVNELRQISPDHLPNNAAKLAFWIDSYNLLTLKNICDHYLISSTEQLGSSTSKREFIVGGHPFAIEDIERFRVKPLAEIQKIESIFLLCSGALGGPRLPNVVITAQNLSDSSEAAARTFINGARNSHYSQTDHEWAISQWFEFNEKFLSKKYKSPFVLMDTYLSPDNRVELGDPSMNYRYYRGFNWYLNDVRNVDKWINIETGK